MDPVHAWLLDPADPAVRAKALVELLGRSPDDAEVVAARREMGNRGSAAAVLRGLNPPFPADPRALYTPKYGSPYHRLIALAEMGLPASDPVGGPLLSACLEAFFGPADAAVETGEDEVCLTGNLARAALLMGRGDDPRVERSILWLVRNQLEDGGWHCWPDRVPHGTLDSWEALPAFAALPRERRTAEVESAIKRGVEFLVANGLGVADPYEAWGRLHFPRHYYYDVLVGLEIASGLGDPRDERLRPALDWLLAKRLPDGRWPLDREHPDVGEGAGYDPYASGPLTPLRVEEPGAPSKWVTLAALRVLRRAGTS